MRCCHRSLDLTAVAPNRLNLKLFDESTTGAMWKSNVKDVAGEVLCVSQFTLLGDTKKNKPDFHNAMVTSGFAVVSSECLEIS